MYQMQVRNAWPRRNPRGAIGESCEEGKKKKEGAIGRLKGFRGRRGGKGGEGDLSKVKTMGGFRIAEEGG